MDFTYSDMQRMLLDSAERVLGARYTLEHRRALRDHDDGVDAEGWANFAELGWLALAVPEERGGLGGSIEDVAVLSMALGAHLVTEPFASSAVLAAHILSHADGAYDELIGELAAGKARFALAHEEPGERYGDGGARKTTLTPSGNGYVLSGQKMMAVDAPAADWLIVSASMPDRDGLVLALVDARGVRVTRDSYPLVDGSRAADVAFDKVAVQTIIQNGDTLLAEAVDRATISLLAQAVSSMETVLEICSAYIKERQQFGQPVGKFQALQHIMADMFVATHQARSALYRVLAHAGEPEAERQRAVSLAKLTIGEASQLVSRQGIQLHGGYGMTDEYEVSHHFRRLMVIEKLYGDLDHHARRFARQPAT